MYNKLCAIISAQQKGNENTAAYYVGEDVMAAIRDRQQTHEAVMRALKARIEKVKKGASG